MSSGRNPDLVLYQRYGCHLCDEMLERLNALQGRHGFSLRLVDVDTDPDLVRRYDHKVPVLAAGGVELCTYHLDESLLLQFLDSAQVGARPPD